MLGNENDKPILQALCAGVPPKLLEEFLARMDEDYFASFPPEKIAEHIRMSAGLSPSQPIQIQVTPESFGQFEITVVGFDYLSEFSIDRKSVV